MPKLLHAPTSGGHLQLTGTSGGPWQDQPPSAIHTPELSEGPGLLSSAAYWASLTPLQVPLWLAEDPDSDALYDRVPPVPPSCSLWPHHIPLAPLPQALRSIWAVKDCKSRIFSQQWFPRDRYRSFPSLSSPLHCPLPATVYCMSLVLFSSWLFSLSEMISFTCLLSVSRPRMSGP